MFAINLQSVFTKLLRVIIASSFTYSSSLLFSQTFQENSIIANYLVGFAEFTEWEETDSRLVIAVLNASGVAAELHKLPQDTLPPGIELEIRNWQPEDSLDDVDILYLPRGANLDLGDIIESAMNNSVLTVSDRDSFFEYDGLIQFVHIRNRLRFFINTEVSEKYNIRFSSKLVSIAVPITFYKQRN